MIFLPFSHHSGAPLNVTLTIVREQGSSGEVAIHYQTRPALSYHPSNQATAGMDYTAKEDTIIMMNGATVTLVTITILPVRIGEGIWYSDKDPFLTSINNIRINLSTKNLKPRKQLCRNNIHLWSRGKFYPPEQ